MRIKHIGMDEWEDSLPETGRGVFHAPEPLSVLSDHSRGELELLAGFNGDRPVALLPLVVEQRPVGTAVLSPPPSMGVPHLGPLLMPASPKRRKQEKLNREFTGGIVEALDVKRTSTLFRTICPTSYADPRPFTWEGLSVEAAFTYVLDTEGESPDDILGSFSKSLRREIRDAEELDVTVTVEGTDAAKAVYDETVARYREQDRGFPMSWEYVRDLTDALAAAERCRVYVARTSDGQFLGGITVLYSNDAAYFWQGGTRTTHENVSINSLLHWRIIRDLVEDPPTESITSYDLMGANNPRLCQYKSKFGADLVPYYVLESKGAPMDLAKKVYQMVAR